MNTLKKLLVKQMKIKKYSNFIQESISGTELVVSVGPAYGETRLQNKTINTRHTSSFRISGFKNQNSKNSLTDEIFFEDDYSDIYNQYLKAGGSQSNLTTDTEKNMEIMLDFLNKKI